ncbi:MAG: penicillin-binding transpeptidase domain-containing protein [Roseburia sp.]
MFENIKDFFRGILKSRLVVIGIVFVLLFSIMLGRVFVLQIINGEEYQENYTYKIVKERTLNSTRGNIYDRDGNLLAYNELAYSITIEDNGSYDSTKNKNIALNAEINQIIHALEENGDTIDNDFEVTLNENDEYEFNVTGTALKRFLADVYGKSSYDELEKDSDLKKKLEYNPAEASANQVMDYLANTKFAVAEDYSKNETYQIVVVRYGMFENSYQKYISTTIASNVSDETVAYISEHSSELQGVEVVEDTIRKYNDSKYFASIIGYTGKISQEEYDELSEENDSYTLNDVIGKAGIEQYMDETLQGEKGYEKLYVDYLGKAVEIIDREEPSAGNDVYLSIRADLQIAAYDLLEQELAGIIYSKIQNVKNYDASSVGSASDLIIPIDDVYFALINNNILDIEHFLEEDASSTEQEVAAAFKTRQSQSLAMVSSELTGSNPTSFESLSEEMQDYITYLIQMLKDENILLESEIDTSDEVYQRWKEGSISTQEYLNHAIAQNWVDITAFTVEEKYSDSAEIYDALCNYILEDMESSTSFSKIVYEYMIQSDNISGVQLCLILFDQGVLAYDDESIAALQNGTISAFDFIRQKIKNLEITPAQLALDPCTASCVITDTDTGELLALVSYPGYDNNKLANSVDAEYFASLNSDLSNPQYNYATQQRTAPGSTFKMLSATAGLAENVITTTETIQDLGKYMNVDNEPECWAYPSFTHGFINVSEALRDSCNYFFYEVGYRLATNNYLSTYSDETGISKIQEYASMYGLDETTGIEIVENEPNIADSYPVMAAIGQSNNNYTTVQLSRYVTAVANSGNVYNYTLLNKVTDSDGNVMNTYAPAIRNTIDVLNTEEWDAIHSGMRMVVENLECFDGFSVAVAGKTGTAQQVKNRANHALFVGYAPYEDPEITIATRIAYGYTSHNAAEVSKNILAYYFGVEDEDELLSGQAEEIGASANGFTD